MSRLSRNSGPLFGTEALSEGLELTPCGGHLISTEKGVHHAEIETAVSS